MRVAGPSEGKQCKWCLCSAHLLLFSIKQVTSASISAVFLSVWTTSLEEEWPRYALKSCNTVAAPYDLRALQSGITHRAFQKQWICISGLISTWCMAVFTLCVLSKVISEKPSLDAVVTPTMSLRIQPHIEVIEDSRLYPKMVKILWKARYVFPHDAR